MPSTRGYLSPWSVFWLAALLVIALALVGGGCAQVAGNYPPVDLRSAMVSARLGGDGWQLLAGSRLPLDQVEAELDQLRSQGFSRRDPQIIKSVARRKKVPAALLSDRTGSEYYRFTAHLEPGVGLTLSPGALEISLRTVKETTIVHDQGFLLEDRQIPAGCRRPYGSVLSFSPPVGDKKSEVNFLVRLPGRGEIIELALVPGRCSVIRKDPLP